MTESWKNIDQVFKDKFSAFEAEPPAHIWDNVRNSIGDNPGDGGSGAQGGGIGSFIIFFIVVLLVSFVAPNRKGDPTQIDATSSPSLMTDYYYSSQTVYSQKGNQSQKIAERDDAIPESLQDEIEMINAEDFSHLTDEDPKDYVIDGLQGQEEPLASVAFQRTSDYVKTNALKFALLEQGVSEKQIKEILNRQISNSPIPDHDENNSLDANWMAGISFTPEAVFFNKTDNLTNQRYSGGIDLIYRRNVLTIQSGIHLAKTNDQGTLKIDYEKYIGSYDNVTNITFDTIDGQIIPEFETAKVDVYDSIPHVDYSPLVTDYYYLDIPLLIGYEIDQRRFTWTLMTGPSLSVKVSENNNAVDPEKLQEDLVLEREYITPLRLKTNMQAVVMAGMRYKLSRHVSFSFQPMLRYNINSMYDKNVMSTKHPYSFGVRSGIVIDF